MGKTIDQHTPMPARFSTWDLCSEIIYKCPMCHTEFLYGEKEKFCHNCGNNIRWEGSAKYPSVDLNTKYWSLLHRSHDFKLPEDDRNKAQKEFDQLMNDIYLGKEP